MYENWKALGWIHESPPLLFAIFHSSLDIVIHITIVVEWGMNQIVCLFSSSL